MPRDCKVDESGKLVPVPAPHLFDFLKPASVPATTRPKPLLVPLNLAELFPNEAPAHPKKSNKAVCRNSSSTKPNLGSKRPLTSLKLFSSPKQKKAVSKVAKRLTYGRNSIAEKTSVSSLVASSLQPITEDETITALAVTPDSAKSSDLEFLELEKQCASAKKSKKSPLVTEAQVYDKVKRLLEEEKKQFQQLEAQMIKFKEESEQRHAVILGLLDNKENVRLTRSRVSPANLLKTALNKNLTVQQEKGLLLYNSIKNGCNFLNTPKHGESADLLQTSQRRLLKTRLQQQCLMLQDTPRKN